MTFLEQLLPQPVIHALGWMILHSVWQGALAALLLGGVYALTRERHANKRHLAACTALALMVALPLFTAFVAGSSHPRALLPDMIPDGLVSLTASSTVLRLNSVVVEAHSPGASLSQPIAPPLPHITWPDRLAVARARISSLFPFLVAGWLVGVLALSIRLCGGLACTRRLKRVGIEPVPADWQRALADLSRRLRVSRPVRLLESTVAEAPVVIGWFRPVLLVPGSALLGLTPAQLEAILAHELAHVRRYDNLVNLLQAVVETLFFYHPAVWWISRRVRIEREHCCDELAVSVHGNRLDYARALTQLEGLRSTPRMAAAVTGASLSSRVRRLLGVSDTLQHRSAPWLGGFAVPATVLSLAITLAAFPQQTHGQHQRIHDRHPAADPNLWRVGLILDAPELNTQAVQFAFFDEDPVPGFKSLVGQMSEYFRKEITKAPGQAAREKSILNLLRLSWDMGFKDIKGNAVGLLTSPAGPDSGREGPKPVRQWVATKTVLAGDRPVQWCIPFEGRLGEVSSITLTQENALDLLPVFTQALAHPFKQLQFSTPPSPDHSDTGTLDTPGTFRDEPEARAIYDRMTRAMQVPGTLYYESRLDNLGKRKGTYRAWLRKPDEARMEVASPDGDEGGRLIRNVDRMLVYWPDQRPKLGSEIRKKTYEQPSRNVYTSEPAPPVDGPIGSKLWMLGRGMRRPILDPGTFFGYKGRYHGHMTAARVLGTETVDGTVCDVIEIAIRNGQRNWTLWVSRDDNLPRRLKEVYHSRRFDLDTEESWSGIRIDTPMPDSLFEWDPPEGWRQYVHKTAPIDLLKPGAGAPDFALRSADGTVIRLSDHRGKVVWLNFWLVGSKASDRELPYLSSLYHRYRDAGLVVIGYNSSDVKDLVEKRIKDAGVTYPHVIDGSEQAFNVYWRLYKARAPNVSYIIDRKGKVADAWIGYREGDERGEKVLASLGIE